MPSSAPSLVSLDLVSAAPLVQSIWNENLAALADEDPTLADELRKVALPPEWRPALGLDGTPTWRLEPDGAPLAWLGGTAAPTRRAAGLLSRFEPAGRNPALACLGAGAEIDWLLARTPPHIAVYVFETD